MEFSVRDTGRGIEAEDMEHLFEPFTRTHAEDRNHFSSAGLGLAISQKLVTAMASNNSLERRGGVGVRPDAGPPLRHAPPDGGRGPRLPRRGPDVGRLLRPSGRPPDGPQARGGDVAGAGGVIDGGEARPAAASVSVSCQP